MLKIFTSTLLLLICLLYLSVAHSEPVTDSDKDGVPDGLDKCPNTHQLKKISADFKYSAAVNPQRLEEGVSTYPVDSSGCEFDSDNDGVVDSQDYCPEDSSEALSAGIAANGCPQHSDADGTPDYRDKCPNTAHGVKTDKDGCEK